MTFIFTDTFWKVKMKWHTSPIKQALFDSINFIDLLAGNVVSGSINDPRMNITCDSVTVMPWNWQNIPAYNKNKTVIMLLVVKAKNKMDSDFTLSK